MKAAVIVFPGSNSDRDLKVAFENAGFSVDMVWHKDTDLPSGIDMVGIPGGFSFGDYLRCGAIAAQSPITRAVVAIRRCRRLLTAVFADSARRTAEGPCMAHGPWRPGSHASVVSRSLVADPPFFCGLTPARKLSFVG